MHKENLIPADEFCANHHIEISFITLLNDNGLIEITTIEESLFIDNEQLYKLEKIVRLYYELDINLEGIESIIHLLQQISSLQDEIILLKNRLRLYETYE
jgi:hypothetical protein